MTASAQLHLQVTGIHKSFDSGNGLIRVVDNVTLDVAHGEFVSLLGPSGCGKSTLLRLIAGLIEPDSGVITIDGQTPAQAQTGREIGYVLQEPSLLPWRSVAANIRLPLDVDQRASGGNRASVDDLIETVGLTGFADYYPHQLSGGMQQRTALARAIAVGASLFLMDEPFGALDEITRASMRYELLRIWEADKKTVVFVTHSIAEAVALSDRVAVISDRPGRIVSVLDIDLPRPRLSHMEREPEFLEYTYRLHDLLAHGDRAQRVSVG